MLYFSVILLRYVNNEENSSMIFYILFLISSMVERQAVNLHVVGSSPASGAILYVGGRQVIQQSPKLPYVGALPTQRANLTVRRSES